MAEEFPHRSVLPEEVLRYLLWRKGGTYLDATVGAGGHSESILLTDPHACVVGVDQDEAALELARKRLQRFGERFRAIHSNFSDMARFFTSQEINWLDGVLADLGVSSMQFDTAERGFSFQQDGPLDMRMDKGSSLSAEQVVNQSPEVDLANLIYELGEERHSRRIARAIVMNRPLIGTRRLAEVVARCFPRSRKQRIHPATRTFQALRIYVNDELNVLDRFLKEMPGWLVPGGRAVIISFHSLEDRRVKEAFRRYEQESLARILTKHVVKASEAEKQINPRSRSARLRAMEKTGTAPESE